MNETKNFNPKKNITNPLTEINVVVESSDFKSAKEQEKNNSKVSNKTSNKTKTKEYGGRTGLEPTRFGDWEKNGRCIDF